MSFPNTFKSMEMRGFPQSLLHLVLPNDTNLIVERLDNQTISDRLSTALRFLPERSADIVRMRCKSYMTFQQIGDRYSVSRNQAKRIFDAAIFQLAQSERIRNIVVEASNTPKKTARTTMIVKWKESRTFAE